MNAVVESRATYVTAAQRADGLSRLVGFFLSFRIIIVLLSVHVLRTDPQVGAAADIALNLILLVVVIFHSFGPSPVALSSALQVPSFRWVLVFLGFSGLSLLWSATASLPAACAFWCAMAADVSMVVLLLRTGDAMGVFSAILEGHVLGACVIAAVAWIMPAQSDFRLGDDTVLGPNSIGYACAFVALAAQYLIQRGGGKWKFAAIFLAVTLLRSLSKTSIVAFAAAEAVVLARDATISRMQKAYVLVFAGLVVLAFSPLIASYFDLYSHAGNQSETLSGRVGIWAVFLSKALERPWVGHGFHSAWKVIPPFEEFDARHAHNELLQQFYAYGIAGVLMLTGVYTSFYRQFRKLPKGPLETLSLGLLVLVLVRGLADTEAFDLSLPLWFIAMTGLATAWSGVEAGAAS